MLQIKRNRYVVSEAFPSSIHRTCRPVSNLLQELNGESKVTLK